MDATAETACAGKHEVSGYPTLKLFKHGKMVADYPGERTTEALVGYMEKCARPPGPLRRRRTLRRRSPA